MTEEAEKKIPKATVSNMLNELLPDNQRCAGDSKDLLIQCCVEFVQLLGSESQEACNKQGKKMISPEHVLDALKALNYNNYIEEVSIAIQSHTTEKKERAPKKSKAFKKLSEEEREKLAEQQQLLFNQSKCKSNPLNSSMDATTTTLSESVDKMEVLKEGDNASGGNIIQPNAINKSRDEEKDKEDEENEKLLLSAVEDKMEEEEDYDNYDE